MAPAQPAPPQPEHTPASRSAGLAEQAAARTVGGSQVLASITLLVIVLALVAFPAVMVVLDVVRASKTPSQPTADLAGLSTTGGLSGLTWLTAFGRSLLYAAIIGLLATLLAWPAAWLLRCKVSPFIAGLVLVPLLLPCYLAYAGWGLLRGPGTALGDWLGGQEPWVNILAGRVAAVWGLGLWAWPIAAVAMLPRLRRIGDDAIESFRLYAPTRAARWRAMLRAQSPALARGWGLVALLMLGSAIPLHVAQVPTYANELWKRLQLTGSALEMWGASWPPLLIALLAAVVLGRAALPSRSTVEADRDATEPGRADGRHTPGRWVWLSAVMVWCLSVVVPAALFAATLRQRRSLSEFWTFNAEALADSGAVALLAAAIALALCVLVWYLRADLRLRSGLSRVILFGAVIALLFGTLAPGVLVGAAYQQSWSAKLDESGWGWGGGGGAVALAHAARFAAVPLAVGLALGSAESRELRDTRSQFGPWSPRAFWLTHARVNWPVAIGAALAVGCLSLHEIEASVMAQPPGLESLARSLLDYLHFARDEQLSAAALNLLGVGSLAALASGLLLGRLLRSR